MISPGTRLGRFLVEEQLGAGGMATVYRVRNEALGSVHALKVLSAELLHQADVRMRFYDEGRIQAALSHPHIVHVSDFVDQPGIAGLVLDYVDGPSLEDYVAALGRPLDEREALAVMLPLMDGLEVAHRKEIVHRDLKPANVMLEHTAEGLSPKLMDFGIARASKTQAGKAMTRADAVMGTLTYMSPEQIRASRDVTAASDVFSLGVILYELCCGQLPFDGPSDFEIGQAIVAGSYPPPRSLRPSLSPVVAAAIARALQPEPSRRFASCREMAAFLAREAHEPPHRHTALVRIRTQEEQRWLCCDGPVVTIGAVSGNDVVVDQPGVSGHHARLAIHGPALWVEDLGSTNGTWANGVRLGAHTPLSIAPATPLRLGSRVLLRCHPAALAPVSRSVMAVLQRAIDSIDLGPETTDPPLSEGRWEASPSAPAALSAPPSVATATQPALPSMAYPAAGSRHASRGARLAAALIDHFLLIGFNPLAWNLFGFRETHDLEARIGLFMFALFCSVVIDIWMLAQRSQTIGKAIVGLRIDRPDGRRAGFWRIVGLRLLLPGILSSLTFGIFALIDLLFIFGSERRTLHDRLADTVIHQLPNGDR